MCTNARHYVRDVKYGDTVVHRGEKEEGERQKSVKRPTGAEEEGMASENASMQSIDAFCLRGRGWFLASV
jgi:hypothetical protein